jgi:MOSC domain-containing protein YiiM
MPLLHSLNVATAQPLEIDGRWVRSAIAKRPVEGRVTVRQLGLAGDEQADPAVHGGLAKAIYAYPIEHYPFWQRVRPQARAADWGAPLPCGFMGENLTLSGLLENQVWIGDVLRFADCELAVSAPRYPCFKFDAVMGFRQAGKLMAANAWCGFYLSVRSTGSLCAGESCELVPGPREVEIRELFQATMSRARR